MSCLQSFDSICRKIVCPSRHVLNERDMIQRKFRSKKVAYQCFDVPNKDNNKLSVIVFQKSFSDFPTVLYLHGNGGHKLESLQIAQSDINLIAFDFGGCGKSEGKFLTYGEKEVLEIEAVINHIKKKYDQPNLKVALWGRSMGASIALMYASLRPNNIYAMILDSPFRKLIKVIENVAEHNNKLPKFLINCALYFVERKVHEIAQMDIFGSDYLMHVNLISKIPMVFAFSATDSVVKEQDVRELYDAYRGKKHLVKVQALHHQDRPKEFIQYAHTFLVSERTALKMKKQEPSNCGLSKSCDLKKGISLSTRKKVQKKKSEEVQ